MLLIIDANVLIDYAKTEVNILALCARHIGPIHMPSVVLDEVEQLDAQTCESLGLTIVEEPLDILLEASEKSGALSFQDHVCLSLAKLNGWVCVSNDKPLHRACEREGVTALWGLRLIIELTALGGLTADEANSIALRIHTANPKHITPAILERFRVEIDWAVSRKSDTP